MPCRQTHYKYDKGRGQRARAKEGENKRKKQSEKRAARTRWRRRQNTRGMNTISNSSLAICPLPSPALSLSLTPTSAMSAIKSKFNQLQPNAQYWDTMQELILKIPKKSLITYAYKALSAIICRLAAELNRLIQTWSEARVARLCCKIWRFFRITLQRVK